MKLIYGISEGLLGVLFLLVAAKPRVLSFFSTVRSRHVRLGEAPSLGIRVLFGLLGTLVLVDSLRGLWR